MTRYSADSRDRVRDAVDMVALIEGRVELRRAGHNSYFGCCPFHEERTASFHVRPEEKHYHCFGCSESGDPFDFVMATEGVDFKGALELLAERFGVTLEAESEDPAEAAARARRERLYALLTRAATFYERMLWESAEAAPARRYLLEERRLEADVLRRFRVGWAPRAWDRLLTGCRAAGFVEAEMLAAGVIQRSRQDPSRHFDRFRAQITFPTADVRGRVIGFGARKLPGDDRDWLGKYVNTAEGEMYSKRSVLYGIDEARASAARRGTIILAEGYTDVLALHQAGLTHAVGIMGTSLTREQVAELVRLVNTVVLCLDADSAGQEAMARAATLCAQTGLSLRVVGLPAGADPGEIIGRDGPEALAGTVAASVPYVAFAVDRLLTRADRDSAEGKDAAIRALAPILGPLPASVLRDELTARAAGALGLTESRLVALLEHARAGGGPPGPPPADPSPSSGWTPASPTAARATGGTARTGVELGVKTERDLLAMCLAGGEVGRALLADLDAEALLTSAVLRAARLRLLGRAPEAGALAATGVSEAEVSVAIDALEVRAARAGRTVSADELEHARLLLELARVDRELQRARLARRGVPELAAARERVRASLSAVLARLESDAALERF
ncbi:DNA primase [Conexibacter sp. DBS9H8]|uniref:DNA primase n=1 Tax=Conexibacter sp. DBS9H8 TaxID=2937801 RepID=UPI00200EA232|nr:DNA primase [Conexibacter sp. DBS9H8]